jgi:peptide/nickel transport system ATP-binding protein
MPQQLERDRPDLTAVAAGGPEPAGGTDADLRARLVDVSVTFRRRGVALPAVRGVSLDVGKGEILAVVGESGSGKSVLGLTMLGLLAGDPAPAVGGRAEVCGVDMVGATTRERRDVRRRHLGAVFQDPMTSLNPTMRIGAQVIEAAGSAEEAIRLLDLVGVPEPARRMRAYPHELSGGLRQRVMIAMAVAGSPDLVVADEPTTALDVTVQAQILSLLRDLRDEIGCSVVLITHDFGVAAQVADRVAVMYGGRLAEIGAMDQVLAAPCHPYTAGLLRSRLDLDLPLGRAIPTLAGEPPDPRSHPSGCAFAPRCASHTDACDEGLPGIEPAPGHSGGVACLHPRVDTSLRNADTELLLPVRTGAGDEPAVRCNSINKTFTVRQGPFKRAELAALRNVVLDVGPGESVAIVGESGSGKSTLLRVVAGLLKPDGGTLDRPGPPPQMVFQDAGASLTPWLTVGELLGERLPRGTRRPERRRRIDDALHLVGLPPEVARTKAGSLSGGQRQRVGFARATIVAPRLLLCDEPTSALDASLAASVLNLLQRLRRELGMAVMFVTHDLAAARLIADRIAVMYLGEIVEVGPAEDIVSRPLHPYTKALMASVPRAGASSVRLAGEPASPLSPPTGCPFHPRCPESVAACSEDRPDLVTPDGTSRRFVACIHHPTRPSAPMVLPGLRPAELFIREVS